MLNFRRQFDATRSERSYDQFEGLAIIEMASLPCQDEIFENSVIGL